MAVWAFCRLGRVDDAWSFIIIIIVIMIIIIIIIIIITNITITNITITIIIAGPSSSAWCCQLRAEAPRSVLFAYMDCFMSMQHFIGPADCSHCSCNHKLFETCAYSYYTLLESLNKTWLQTPSEARRRAPPAPGNACGARGNAQNNSAALDIPSDL